MQCAYCTCGMIMAGVGAPAPEPRPEPSGDRRVHGWQYLPVRHLSADHRRDPHGRAGREGGQPMNDRTGIATELDRRTSRSSPSATSCARARPTGSSSIAATSSRRWAAASSSSTCWIGTPTEAEAQPPGGRSRGAAAAAASRAPGHRRLAAHRRGRPDRGLHRQGRGRPEHPDLADPGRRRGAARAAPSSIRMVMADTQLTPFDMGTFGSRTTPDMSRRLRRAAAAAREIAHRPRRRDLEGRPRRADRRPTGPSSAPGPRRRSPTAS